MGSTAISWSNYDDPRVCPETGSEHHPDWDRAELGIKFDGSGAVIFVHCRLCRQDMDVVIQEKNLRWEPSVNQHTREAHP